MNVSYRLLTVTLLAAGFVTAGRTGEGATVPLPAPVASDLIGDAAAGKQTFKQECSICHGAHAQGFIGPHIGGIKWTTAGLHVIVRGGVGGYGGMPAFNAGAVTDRNIADIAAYLASLAPVPAPTSVPAPTPAPAAAAPVAAAPAGGDANHGRVVFSADCAACHGATGQGGFGPSLRGEKSRKDAAAAITWIENPKPPMPKLYPSPLSEKDVEDVAAYVESL